MRGVLALPAALRWAIACLLLAGAALAQAQQEAYSLEAPDELLPLLRSNLPQGLSAEQEIGDAAARLGLIRRLRQRIPELLAVEGYFSPQVDVDVNTQPIAVKVTPGPRTRIASVDIEFQGVLHDDTRFAGREKRLVASWGLPAGQFFRQQDWSNAKDRLLTFVSARDFLAARIVDSKADIDPAQAEAHLHVVVDSGPAFKLGTLQIEGLQDYPASLVQRYNTLREGEDYSQERLLTLQSALQNTPYFSAADVSVDPDPAQAEHATVHVKLAEARPRGITLGLGYSTNTGARGEVGYRNANWLGRALQLNTGLSLEQKRQALVADVFLPPADQMIQYSVGGIIESTDIENLRTRRTQVGIARTHPHSDIETRIGLSAQTEHTKADGGEEQVASALALNWSWTRRHVNNLLNPRNGYVLNLQFGGGTQLLLSDANFVRSYARLVTYFPMATRDVLIGRVEGGYTATHHPENVPQEFLFRTGGSLTVRGYDYLALGVQDGTAVIGGRYLTTGSLEYDHWMNERWGFAFFTDAGNAGNDLNSFKLKKSVGTGLRFRTPAGPIAFDIGYAIDEHVFRPHISIAIAF